MNLRNLIIGIAAIVGVIGVLSAYTVQQAEQVLVLQFGENPGQISC